MVAPVEWMRTTYRREYDRNPVFTSFLTILILSFIIFVIAIALTGGDTMYNALIVDHNDTFMDHFNSIMYSYDHPYTKWKVMYPPLITLFYSIMGHFTVPFTDVLPGQTLAFALRDSHMGLMSLLLIVLIIFFILRLIFSKIVKEKGIRKELMFIFAVLLAAPFIFAVERGNSILMALVFCFIFLLGYRSENKIIRYASYIALGCAAGIKLYPAMLLLLILRDRNYKEAGICAAIVAALIFVPFIFTDGNPIMLFDTAFSSVPKKSGVVNIGQLMTRLLSAATDLSQSTVSVISYAVVGLFTLISAIVILFDREMKFWKVVALLSCNLVLGFGVGAQYLFIYMSMPIFLFLSAEREMTRENIFYVICLAATMILIPGVGINSQINIRAIESAFTIILAAALIGEGLMRIYRRRSAERPADTAAGT